MVVAVAVEGEGAAEGEEEEEARRMEAEEVSRRASRGSGVWYHKVGGAIGAPIISNVISTLWSRRVVYLLIVP
jgi:hypothetical protein